MTLTKNCFKPFSMRWPSTENEQRTLLKSLYFQQLSQEESSELKALIASNEDVSIMYDALRLETVDNYLADMLSGEELSLFQGLLKSDPEVREDVAFSKMLNTTLGNPEIEQVKATLESLEAAPQEHEKKLGGQVPQNEAKVELKAVRTVGNSGTQAQPKVVKASFWQQNKRWLSIAAMLVLLALPIAYFLTGPSGSSAAFADQFETHHVKQIQTMIDRAEGNMGFAGNRFTEEIGSVRKLMDKAEWEQAAARAERLLKKYPDQRELLLLTTIAQLELGNGKTAMNNIRKYEQGKALDPAVMYYKAWAFSSMNKQAEAETLLQNLAKGKSKFAENARKMIQNK